MVVGGLGAKGERDGREDHDSLEEGPRRLSDQNASTTTDRKDFPKREGFIGERKTLWLDRRYD